MSYVPTIATKIRPIKGMYKRAVVIDISTALGMGLSGGYFYWYGYHVPAVRHRDRVYAKLEEDRLKGMQEDPVIGPPSDDD